MARSAISNRVLSLPWRLNIHQREAVDGYLFALPWIIGFAVFVAVPFVSSFFLSFTSYRIGGAMSYIGIGNYQQIFTQDPLFWPSLYNTFYYVIFSVSLGVIASLLMALLMNNKVRGIAFFRTSVYVPSVVSGVALSFLWLFLLDPSIGLLDYVLRQIGLTAPLWLQSEVWAKPALILMRLSTVGGATMVIFLAGLQGVPQALYEAAEIDGASRLTRFWHVTLPMISPVMLFNVVVGIIGGFQIFTEAYVMTEGGPNNATMFYVLHLYNTAFYWGHLGLGSALAWVLFVIILVFTLIQLRVADQWVYYEH